MATHLGLLAGRLIPPLVPFSFAMLQDALRGGAKESKLMSFSRLAAIAALSILGVSPVAAQPALQSLTITVWSYGFAPHPIHLAAGRPVTLTFVNRSGSGHDFTAGAFFANSRDQRRRRAGRRDRARGA